MLFDFISFELFLFVLIRNELKRLIILIPSIFFFNTVYIFIVGKSNIISVGIMSLIQFLLNTS